mgnify:CR=1 FL=1
MHELTKIRYIGCYYGDEAGKILKLINFGHFNRDQTKPSEKRTQHITWSNVNTFSAKTLNDHHLVAGAETKQTKSVVVVR